MEFRPDLPPMGMPPLGAPPEMPECDVSHIRNKRLDLRYGEDHPRQVFDLYYPETGEGPFPVLLHFHGGGFMIGDKRDFHIADFLEATKRGYAFASCSYRRSGEAPFPAAVLDCRRFVAYLRAHAAELQLDPARFCAFGGSAGGNLSALLAMNIPQFFGEDAPIDASVACAVDWFGPTDFRQMDAQARANGISFADHDEPHSPESRYMGGALPTLDADFLDRANPIHYLSARMSPLLIEHGRDDVLVPFQQSELLARSIEDRLGPDRAVFLPLEHAGHDDDKFKSPENLAILWAFLDLHLKGISPAVPLEKMPLPQGMGSGAAGAAFGLKPGMPPMPPMPPMGGAPCAGPVEPPKLAQEILDGIAEKYLDIAYCDQSPAQKLDLYLPNGVREGKLPVIVHFHGGAFMICTKRDDSLEPMLRGLERGYAVVSAEYRKSGEARYPAMVYDAKTVIRWVRANAERYGLDAARIAVWGPSSGGWLSSYVAVTNGNAAFEDLRQGYADQSSAVQACIDWCGPCGGFLEMDAAFRRSGIGVPDHDAPASPESLFLGAHITEVPELVRLASPIAHVSAQTPPFLIVHGGADPVVPVEQSVSFCAAINAAAPGRAQLHVVPDKPHHGDPWYHERWLSDECLDFLDSILK